VGAFEVLNKADGAHYTEDDLIILEMLAELACSALQNNLLEKRVLKSLQETSELDRLKRDFIGITSHELRTPLGLILGHATFLRELLDSPYHDHVDTIIRNADKLKTIIDGLSRLDDHENHTARLHPGMFSVRQMVRDTSADFQEFAGQRKITLEAVLGEDELLVQADGNKIAIALGNLVKNALTFTNENGQVRITARAVSGFVQVSVIDDGIGIAADALPHVFDRFFQVEPHLTRRYGGMGLGLSVARDMIELHGGRIWAESEPGSGSTFSFLLPRDLPPPPESASPFES
jgi:signal transduction histidine kinase